MLFQPNTNNEKEVISYTSRILTTQEQKLSTYDRELCAITFALSQYEFIIFGSKFPITTFTVTTLFFFFSLVKEILLLDSLKLKCY